MQEEYSEKASDDIDSYEESFFNIETSVNYGDILINNDICSEETRMYVGGISSYQITGNKLSECYNRGNISANNSTGVLVIGGIMGESISRVERSYSIGEIIVPTDNNDTISSVCNIKTPYLYAPEGPAMAQDYIVYNCYCLNNGLTPCHQDSAVPYNWYNNVFLLSDAEMKEQKSFASFDFDTVWAMEENGYPVLQNQPVLPERIPETSTTESTTEPTTESTTESTTEPTTEPSTENTTEPSNDECPLANLWIVRAVKWVLNLIWNAITFVVRLF